ncbi:adenosine 5'-monophosphoramidase HINT3-like isoform X1 [Tubulanus polymorphus]|uniref:adenosine 5'-monophosphoramidase HINT3-like isoform X1 n=1 Tax=Tubulanus polymorphus TaxID=672921 RepID=UPI003DA5255C
MASESHQDYDRADKSEQENEKQGNIYKPGCIFCAIAQNNDPKTTILYEDDDVVVFKDHRPAAPHHYLSIPKQHIRDANSLGPEHIDLVEHLVTAGKQVLQEQGGNVNDVRFGFHWAPFNSVYHLHLHVLSPVSGIKRFFVLTAKYKPGCFWFRTVDWIRERLKKLKEKSDIKNPKL